MQIINGNLKVMPVADIIQWAENNKRTGILLLSQGTNHKKFYIEDGNIVYLWSNCDGDQVLNLFESQLAISPDDLKRAYSNSELLGLPFVSYLLSESHYSQEYFENALRASAEAVLTNALEWNTGSFEFNGELPVSFQNSPVKLSAFNVLLESLRQHDECRRGNHADSRMVINTIQQNILNGSIDIPPIPEVMQQLSEKISDPGMSLDEIITCITDQILVGKILRICNSPYYGRIGSVSTLKEAVVLIGLKSLLSIVTVHAMSSYSPRNEMQIRSILQHSLVCAMIARQITRDIRGNTELAFICGLLHDIGKTILLEILCDYTLPPSEKERLLEENHAEVGYLLATKWNFGDDIKAVIRYHHSPELANGHAEIVELINLADAMANLNAHPEELSKMGIPRLDLCQASIDDMLKNVEIFDREANGILCFS